MTHLKTLKKLIKILESSHLQELEIEEQGVRIRLCKGAQPNYQEKTASYSPLSINSNQIYTDQPRAEVFSPVKAKEKEDNTIVVNSPFVGTFYRSSSPESAPFVEEGDVVKKGDVLCIVEAMKLMNEIESDVDGKIVSILVQDSDPVEYGQTLFKIASENSSFDV
ncbi:MAG: acetyl-CoA carboxylase biotin carboxyl carrier protein [Deltaproteobacteria bacterium]|nr:acetyl-CoA carboxylase biotin carboxyl carrier protein [Deltaproteobacteria bacterium]